jgi:phospholipase C
VPALVISPWVARGVIDHTTYDHTSILSTVQRLFGVGTLTQRDANAADTAHLLSLAAPRTDTPLTLPEPAHNPTPIGCSDEAESEDMLLRRRSELRLAQATGAEGRRDTSARVDETVPSSTQLGFAQVALMRVLQTAKPPERERWIQQFKAIETRTDAELFIVEAKLQVRYDVDLKRPRRFEPPPRARRSRTGLGRR